MESLTYCQGRNFESRLFKSLCGLLEIHKTRTTPYHPQCDGLVERINRSLIDMLSEYCEDNPTDWDLWLQQVLCAYRSAPQTSTGLSPFELVYGRTPRLPVDTTMGIPLPEPTNPHAYLNNLLDTQRRAWELVDANITAAQERQRRNFRVHQTRSYKIGDMIYLHCPAAKQGCRRKLKLLWKGPCMVVQVGDENNYVIRDVVRNKKRRVHYNRLKPCYRREQVHEEVIVAEEAEESIQGAHR